MEKKALINDVSLVLQWRFTQKEDTAYGHCKALDTHIYYTVLQVLKGILTSWAQYRSGESSSNSTSEQNPCFRLALCGFCVVLLFYFKVVNCRKSKYLLMKMKDPNGFIQEQALLLAIAIPTSLHSSIAKSHKTLLFHSKLLWTCQVYHVSGGDLLTWVQISTMECAEIKPILWSHKYFWVEAA